MIKGVGNAQFPIFSPDGGHIAFTGLLGAEQQTARDPRVFVVTADGKNEPQQLAADLDRPAGFSLWGMPVTWLSPDELAFTTVEEATIAVRRAKLGESSARPVVAGDTQVMGITTSRQGENPVLSYVSAWVDSPAEVFCLELGNRGRPPVKVSRAGDKLLGQVELLPTERLRARAHDGTEVEYFVLRPRPGRTKRRAPKLPLFLEIHGGPDLYNPFSELFPYYQSLAGAGYLVLLPNPRGSIGYGEAFTKRLRGHWGEADFADVMECADDVIERGLADPGRQFVGVFVRGVHDRLGYWAYGPLQGRCRRRSGDRHRKHVRHVRRFGIFGRLVGR